MTTMTDQDAVLVALRRIIRATDQNSKRLGRSTGLTVPQIVLLRAIDSHPEATQGFLTGQVSLSPATVSTILDRLEERGLIHRTRNNRDKRMVNVSLSAEGRRLLAGAPQPLQEEFRARFNNLPAAQQHLIVQALDNVATMMDAHDIDAAPMLTLGNIPEQLPAGMGDVRLRPATAEDGAALHALVRICPPLDQNSMYCNLLQCAHFGDTAVVAERDGKLMGAITGYCPPGRDDTLFVWQVATHPDMRGKGLARQMLNHLLARDSLIAVRFLETTVTPDNKPSMALFTALARERGTSLVRSPLFERDRHFHGNHDTEWLLRIGPMSPRGAPVHPSHQAKEAVNGA